MGGQVARVEQVGNVDVGGQTTAPQGLGKDMGGQRHLARGAVPVQFDDTSPGEAAHSQGQVQGGETGRDDGGVAGRPAAQALQGTAAPAPFEAACHPFQHR
ncbi:MAG: hypothetical protein M1401_07890 [Chloroflexi bacterium]|nr:hypothetical protein [Chloroflexota bacterium]